MKCKSCKKEFIPEVDPKTYKQSKRCSECISKQRLASQKYYKSHQKERLEYKNNLNRIKPWFQMFSNAKKRAKKAHLEFTITIEDILKLWTDTCPVLGIKIASGAIQDRDNSPSLDRKDNSKGYIPENIRIISYKANRLKSSATIDEMRLILKYMEGE